MFARFLAVLTAFSLAACATAAPAPTPPIGTDWAAQCTDWDEWDKPGPPFRIHGSTYYVGTCGISAILLTDPEGHILIDSGTEAGADIVAANIETLGFRLSDLKTLLMSHEHYDHVGGMARLQELTGAELLVSEGAAQTVASGVIGPDDPQYGMHEPFPAAEVSHSMRMGDGSGVARGANELTAIETPGHTQGALSWQWRSCDEAGDCKWIVYADSLSPISNDTYRFRDHPEYITAYYAGIDKLAETACDIVLAPHPSAAGMRHKLVAGDLTAGPDCRSYAGGVRQRLDARLAQEAEPTGE